MTVLLSKDVFRLYKLLEYINGDWNSIFPNVVW
jgi:hypothetical protein